MARDTIPASISSTRVGPGWCLSLVLALVLSGCNTQTIRESDPAAVRAHADTAYRNEDWQTAEQDYFFLTRNTSAVAEDWFRLGNIYARTNRPDAAIAAYREALKQDQDNGDAWFNLGMVQLRQATQTFIDMVNHTDVQDPLNLRARYAVTTITELLETRFTTPAAE
ncbi:MAG: tetratricopeptide repeat protein [Gammaproteobacteria bacterium]